MEESYNIVIAKPGYTFDQVMTSTVRCEMESILNIPTSIPNKDIERHNPGLVNLVSLDSILFKGLHVISIPFPHYYIGCDTSKGHEIVVLKDVNRNLKWVDARIRTQYVTVIQEVPIFSPCERYEEKVLDPQMGNIKLPQFVSTGAMYL